MALEDISGMLDSIGASAGAVASPLADVQSILDRLGGASLDAAGKLRDAGGRFISMADQAKAAESGIAGAKEALEALKGPADAAGNAAAGAGAKASAAGKAFNKFSDSLQASAGKAAMSMTHVSGPIGAVQDALAKLGPYGQAAAVALGVATLGVTKLAEAIAGGMGLAIEMSERAAMMKARFAALAGSAAGGAEVEAMLSKMATTLPFAAGQVKAWGQELLAAGVKGAQLEADIKAVAAATALMDGGGEAAMTFFKRLGEGGPAADKLLKSIQEGGAKTDKLLKATGISLADLGGKEAVAKMNAAQLHEALAKAMAQKGKGPLDAMMNSWPVILDKAKAGFMSLFSGLGPVVEPFMKAVKSLFEQFNKGTGPMKALKAVVAEVFGAIFKYATMAVKAVSAFVKENFTAKDVGGIWASMKPIVMAVGSAIGTVIGYLVKLLANKDTLMGLKVVFVVLAVAVGLLIAPFLLMIGVTVLCTTTVIRLIGVIVGAFPRAWAAVKGFVTGSLGALGSLVSGALSAGSNFVGGLINGILAGAGKLIAAVVGMAKGALGAFMGALGMKSPSTIMMKHGDENIAGAAATGIDKGSAKVAKASAKMGDAAKMKDGGKGGGAGGDSGGGKEVHYHYSGPVEHYPTFRENMIRFLEETRAEAGA